MGATSTLSNTTDRSQQPLTEQFIQERTYLKNVTPKTIQWYRHSFRAFEGAMESRAMVGARITKLRTAGVSAISVNTYLRAVNAFFRWAHTEGHLPELLRVPKLKEPQHVLATLTPEGRVSRLMRFAISAVRADTTRRQRLRTR